MAGTNGQFNDEYDMNAFEKTKKKHYIPRKIDYDKWDTTTPNLALLPSSCDDEMYDDYIITTVDLNMVRNAAANALSALVSQAFDSKKVVVTKANCLRVSCFDALQILPNGPRCVSSTYKLTVFISSLSSPIASLLTALLSNMRGGNLVQMH